jgi:histidinol-phosphate aminotransferase
MNSNVDDGAYLRRNMQNREFFNPTTSPAHERGKHIIRMDLNECPYPPSPKAIAAMQAHADKLNRYPDGTCPQLTERLAAMTGVPARQICWGSGSTQLLKSIMEMVIAPGEHLVSPSLLWHRFHGVYETLDADVTMVPNLGDGHIDIDGLMNAIGNNTRLAVLLTPNNPTGLMLDADQIRRVCDETPENVLLFIDEAYHEFAVHAGGADALQIVKDRKGPWVVSRTFSKAYALAGARLGYAYCSSEELANALRLITSTFNISAFAEVGALAALDDTEYKDFIMDSNATERGRIIDGLKDLGCKPMQSVTNFVAAETGVPGAQVVAEMRARGIRIGRLADAGFETYVRISMGQPSDTDVCLGALKEVLEELRGG